MDLPNDHFPVPMSDEVLANDFRANGPTGETHAERCAAWIASFNGIKALNITYNCPEDER